MMMMMMLMEIPLVRFIQATTNILDEATDDIYAFLKVIDDGSVKDHPANRTQLGIHHKAKYILLHLLYVCFLLTGVQHVHHAMHFKIPIGDTKKDMHPDYLQHELGFAEAPPETPILFAHKDIYLSEQMLVVDPSRFADRMHRHCYYSHEKSNHVESG
jgi:hypothetical protein